MRPRRHRRRARSGPAVLFARARDSRARGGSAADPGVRGRSPRDDRARRLARRARCCCGSLARGTWVRAMVDTMHPAVTNGAYDVTRIRADFPALALQVYGKPLVYLDNAASAQKPKQVLDRLESAYTKQYANVHRGLHYLANEATEAYESAREKVRAFLNAERKE